jgi:LmbE family N-acetylglucosaminyl deacetylase
MARESLLAVSLTLAIVLASYVQAGEGPLTVATLVSRNTRLLVFAPHPDDETLGAGGLIQRVLSTGGAVKVVFMTSGDGFPAGVAVARHTLTPTAQDYRTYGTLRQEEAKRALAVLGVAEKDIIFLGFPDAGLCPLCVQFLADKGLDYTSPFTLEDRPPSADAVLPSIEYNGEDLQREIVWVLSHFRPTLVVTTHVSDRHPDHCATYLFVRQVLHKLQQQNSTFHPLMLTFLIHFGGWWPMNEKVGMDAPLHPPQDFPEPVRLWLPLSLSSTEVQTKSQALLQYHSQMLVMDQYLLSFARANELFIPDHLQTQAELQQVLCCGKKVSATVRLLGK